MSELKAVGYVRVSTDEQAKEGVSLDNQRQRIELFCQAKDWHLQRVYTDEGRSGKDLKRDGIQQLVEDAKAKDFDVVVVYKVDRLSRRQRDLWYLIDDVFEASDIGFVSVNEPFDTTSAVGKACLGMIGVFAQLERDQISERTKDALAFKKSQGYRLGTQPLGFSIVGGQLESDGDELASVKYAKKLRQDDLTLRQVAQQMNDEGLKTKRSGRWFASTVRYLLNNQIYAEV